MWIGIAQVLAVVLGFVILGVVLKYYGWPDMVGFRFHPLATGLRTYGAWLLLVPLVWTAMSIASMHYEWPFFSPAVLGAIGISIVSMIGLAFLFATFNPGVRGLYMYFGPPASNANAC